MKNFIIQSKWCDENPSPPDMVMMQKAAYEEALRRLKPKKSCKALVKYEGKR